MLVNLQGEPVQNCFCRNVFFGFRVFVSACEKFALMCNKLIVKYFNIKPFWVLQQTGCFIHHFVKMTHFKNYQSCLNFFNTSFNISG